MGREKSLRGLGTGFVALAATSSLALGPAARTSAAAPLQPVTTEPTTNDGGPDLWRAELEAAQAELVEGLEDLATWCSNRKLYASRDRVLEQILLFQPDHSKARKGLKHTQDADGAWHPPEKPASSKDYKKRDIPKMEERHAEVVASYRDACLGVLRAQELDPLQAEGAELLQSLLWLDADDEEVHGLQGEVRDGERWVLTETLTARDRRAVLREHQQKALGASGKAVKRSKAAEDEEALGVAWRHVMASDKVRALGTGDETEVLKVAQASHAVGEFFRGVFECDTEHWDASRIFVLANDGERDVFLSNHPKVPPEARETYAALVGTGFPESADVVMWNDEMLHRLDSSTRMTMGSFLFQTFGTTAEHGWVWEGFGMYLTWRLIGTRLTWYSPGVGSDADLRIRLADPQAKWMNEAYQLMKGQPAALETFLHKGLAEMDARDMLLSYVLAAYLVEGRPKEVPTLLLRVGQGEPAAEVLSEVSGLPLDVLEARFRRWLTERR